MIRLVDAKDCLDDVASDTDQTNIIHEYAAASRHDGVYVGGPYQIQRRLRRKMRLAASLAPRAFLKRIMAQPQREDKLRHDEPMTRRDVAEEPNICRYSSPRL